MRPVLLLTGWKPVSSEPVTLVLLHTIREVTAFPPLSVNLKLFVPIVVPEAG